MEDQIMQEIEETVRMIQLLETVAGHAFTIVEPAQFYGTSFVDYLRASQLAEIDVKLKLGEWEVSAKWKVEKTINKDTVSYSYGTPFSIRLADSQGKVLFNESATVYHHYLFGKDPDMGDVLTVKKYLLDFIRENLIGRHNRWTDKGIFSIIYKKLEARGEVFPPMLDILFYEFAEEGKVKELEEIIAQCRNDVIMTISRPQCIALFDEDVKFYIGKAKKYQALFDENIPLKEKLDDNLLLGNYLTIPGKRRSKKNYAFLLYFEKPEAVKQWKLALKKFGYAGSLLIFTLNHPTGIDLAKTGQLDAIFLDDRIGYSSKEWWLYEPEDIVRDKFKRSLSTFVWDKRDRETELPRWFRRHFRAFLYAHFPLE